MATKSMLYLRQFVTSENAQTHAIQNRLYPFIPLFNLFVLQSVCNQRYDISSTVFKISENEKCRTCNIPFVPKLKQIKQFAFCKPVEAQTKGK